MTNHPRRILLVAPTLSLAKKMLTWLDGAYALEVVSTFTAAKARLEERPDLLITEVKLGDFNGLHLAVRALAAGVPALVLGDSDVVLEQDAHQLGAAYRPAASISGEEMRVVVRQLMAAAASPDPQHASTEWEVVTERRGPAVTYLFPSRVGFTSPVTSRAVRRDPVRARHAPVIH